MTPKRQAYPRRSGTVTLRFKDDLLEQLRIEADSNRISLNTLATQIFKSHVEYGAYAARAGMVSFPKELLVRMMEMLSEDDITKLSEYIAKNSMKDTILLMKGRYTKDSLIDFIEAWIRALGFFYRHKVINDIHSFAIQHDMGRKWSVFIANFFKFMFEDLGAKWKDSDATDNSVVFNVKLKHV